MKTRTVFSYFVLLAFVLNVSGVSVFGQSYGKNGMVVSANSTSTQIGVDILKKGGNAIDAAVATAFSLAVTLPNAGNIGGGGFIVFMDQNGQTTTFDFREKAPLAASPEMYLDDKGEVDQQLFRQSIKSIGVPGTVAGLYKAHEKYGKLPWSEVVQPAIDIAEQGFSMNWSLYRTAQRFIGDEQAGRFIKEYFLNPDGTLPEPGELWKQPELANTLKIIRDKGHDGFYKGEVAKKIVSFMKENGGLITKKDLEKYEAVERAPVMGTYKGYEIFSMPPPSSGGATLIQMMNMMELADLQGMGFGSAAYVHYLTESMRRAYADRAEFLGDPDFNPEMPVDQLISKEHAKARYANIDMSKASPSDPNKYGQLYDGNNTTHLSVMDKDLNAVSLTYTLEWSYGSKLGSDELGFLFNNEMDDFNPQPGVTTETGQIGTSPNQIKPEKRMLSSMTPTIVGKDGRPYLVIGSPGGRTIINTVFQTVLNVLEFEMPVHKAIEALKIHHQWLPNYTRYEKNMLSPDSRMKLEAMGHTLREYNSLGALMGITYDPEHEVFTGAADSSRPDGGALGY